MTFTRFLLRRMLRDFLTLLKVLWGLALFGAFYLAVFHFFGATGLHVMAVLGVLAILVMIYTAFVEADYNHIWAEEEPEDFSEGRK